MDLQKYKQRLQEVRSKMDSGEIDEIPLDARPKMPDFENKSYIIVSYSRKDFDKVYLLLAYLYSEGYRLWYDNGMKGTKKWLDEYKDKYEHPNCLGTLMFFSDNYISNATKEELTVIYKSNGYVKRNVTISLNPLREMNPDKILKKAIVNDRITIENAASIKPVLSEIITQEKEKTIHRYTDEADIPFLAEKIGAAFQIRDNTAALPDSQGTAYTRQENENEADAFEICNGELIKYTGTKPFVSVPEGVVSIREWAFDGCKTLMDLTIPDSVVSIGAGAFHNCGALTKVKLPGKLPAIEMCTFDGCISLESITIPESVTVIGSDAFEACRSLKRIVLPEGVIGIGSGAFYCCTGLEEIVIPHSIQSLGTKVFFNCDLLWHIRFNGTKEQWVQVEKAGNWREHIRTVQCADGIVQLQ